MYNRGMWTDTKRIFRSGFVNFWRNGFVSLSSILVMIVTLFFIGSVLFTGVILRSSLQDLRDKVDINVYFVTTAEEKDILDIKASLERLPEVKSVVYTNRDDALKNFKERHANDELTLQTLGELNDNPLGARFDISAKNPGDYQAIANLLKSDNFLKQSGTSIIGKVNYFNNKTAIEKLSRIINAAERLGLILSVLLIVLSVFITLNTIRLSIYNSREDISVMRLVGAGSHYIRGPFVVSGVLYGLISGIITLGMFYPITLWLQRMSAEFFLGADLFEYYVAHFPSISAIIVGAGVVIGAISSWIGTRRYLKI